MIVEGEEVARLEFCEHPRVPVARSSSCVGEDEEEELRPAWSRASIPRWRQQSVPHSGVREALLAPTAALALPDAARSSSCMREEEELRSWNLI